MLVKDCTAIRAIDYSSEQEVVLSVDSSWMAVGFILSQLGEDGKRYPLRYGSITWNETEQRYSQAKLELYGLFRALKAVKIYVVGVKNFIVEVDAKYIKGMINNPDIQPNAPINRWIAGILLFDFKLRHVPGKDHASADGLSRIVLESPVQSGLLPIFGRTETETGPPSSIKGKKTGLDRKRPRFSVFFSLKTGLRSLLVSTGLRPVFLNIMSQ